MLYIIVIHLATRIQTPWTEVAQKIYYAYKNIHYCHFNTYTIFGAIEV